MGKTPDLTPARDPAAPNNSADAERLRSAMRRWASGVAVVTSCEGRRVHGMTVSSFTSVSLDPPLVLVCADRESETGAMIARTQRFAVNVLAACQQDLSHRFAREGDEQRRFEGLEWTPGRNGAPRLDGVLAYFGCRLEARHPAGDHWILIGRVEEVWSREGEPLVYLDGGYRRLAPTHERSDPDRS